MRAINDFNTIDNTHNISEQKGSSLVVTVVVLLLAVLVGAGAVYYTGHGGQFRKDVANMIYPENVAQITELSNQLEQTKVQLAAKEAELKIANTKLANALIPEATVKEAAVVHIVNPTKAAFNNAVESVKGFGSKITELWKEHGITIAPKEEPKADDTVVVL